MIGEKIKERRTALNLTQEELAQKLGYKSKSAINKIELGINDIAQSKIKAFAKALNCTVAYLMEWDNESAELFKIEKKRFPLLGEIACGEPIFCNEDRESYVMAGTDIDADFCLKAKGDSMINARIFDGDIVFIKDTEVNNGEIAAVIIDDEVLLKRYFYYQKENILILQSENPKYQPQKYINEQLEHIRVIGKAIAFQSNII